MRTTTLFCAALVLTGCATHRSNDDAKSGILEGNDMPIEVADSSGGPLVGPGAKAAPIFVNHKESKIHKPMAHHPYYHIKDGNRKAKCLVVGAEKVQLGDAASWSATLYNAYEGDGFELSSRDNNEVEIHGLKPTEEGDTYLKTDNLVISYVSVTIFNEDGTTLPPKILSASPKVYATIHYCKKGNCGNSNPCQ